jgi:O-antigen/teichoic acid export membrane protein
VSAGSSSDAAREAARGTGLILAGAMVGQVAEYAYRFVLARGLGADGFGTFNQARSVLLVLIVLASLGLPAGVKRFVAKFGEEGRSAEARRAIRDGWWMTVAFALAGGLVLFALAGPLSRVFRNPELRLPLVLLAAGLPAAVALEYVTRVGEAFRSFRSSVIARQILEPVLRVAATVALVAVGAGLPAICAAYGAASVLALGVAVALVARIGRLRALDRGPTPSQFGPVLRFSIPLVFGGVLFDFAERVDILMIGLYRDESHVGVYAVGSALARALLLLVSSTLPAVGTLAAEAVGRNSPQDIARLHRTTSRWMLFFTAPLAAALLLFPGEAITVLFGAEYLGATSTLRVLVVAYLAGVLTGPVGVMLNVMGKAHWTFGNMVLRTGLNVVLNIALIPRFGIVGAAWGTLIALLLACGLLLFQLASVAPIRGSYAGWGRPLLVLGAASAAGWGTARLASALALPVEAAAAAGGLVLLATFAVGVRRIPGCLEAEDLELLRPVLGRLTWGARRKAPR